MITNTLIHLFCYHLILFQTRADDTHCWGLHKRRFSLVVVFHRLGNSSTLLNVADGFLWIVFVGARKESVLRMYARAASRYARNTYASFGELSKAEV